MTLDPVLRAGCLVKEYGGRRVVDGVDIEVCKGEIFGFLGPNGAGKTTVIRMLTTLTEPTSGSVEFFGYGIGCGDDPVKERIGIVQQHAALDAGVTVRDNIVYHALLHRMSLKEADRRVRELSEAFGLGEYLNKVVSGLSGGWRRWVTIVCAMVHDPDILFLDEPTAGLDTQSRHVLWKMIRVLNSRGKTILVTTHYMDEAEELCDRVAVMDSGRVIASGTPSELCEATGKWTADYTEGGVRMHRRFRDRDEMVRFSESLPEGSGIVLRETDLEDVFLELTDSGLDPTEVVRP